MINYLSSCWLVFLLLPLTTAGQIPLQLQPGLEVAFYRGQDFQQLVYQTTDAQVNFSGQHGSVPGLLLEALSVRWSGYLYVPVTGKYKFNIAANASLRLWLDDQLLLGAQSPHRAHVEQATRQLVGHTFYRLRVERLLGPHSSQASLAWVRPDARPLYTLFAGGGQRKKNAPVVIPGAYFYSDLPETRAGTLRVAAQPLTTSNLPEPSPGPRHPVIPDLSASARSPVGTLPPFYFAQGQARLLPSSRPELPRLAQLLREHPALHLRLVGHTDNLGDAQLNTVLSQHRAETVRDYLLRQGITADRITATGYGGQQPAANNNDADQRARNRRVEVMLL